MSGSDDYCHKPLEQFSVTATGPSVQTNRRLWLVYLQCYFVTIASILGTGVLGLPVTLSRCGLYPFVISFLGGFFIQALLICLFVDLLQRTCAYQLQVLKDAGTEHVPLNNMDEDDEFDDTEDSDQAAIDPVLGGQAIMPDHTMVTPPNLHLMGVLFLKCGVRQMFDAVLIIQFIALLISYALAGSEAYAQVLEKVLELEVNHFYVIPVFVWLLSFAVVFALQCIQPLVSILTFAKGSLLLATVVVTFFVGASIHHEINNDFTYMGASFLMGTVALGGVINVMPFLYHKIQPVQAQIRGFRWSIILGLTTCTILNILWCWSILEIVPQTDGVCFQYQVKHNNSLHTKNDYEMHQIEWACSHNVSLESSQHNGEISTIPLVKIIDNLYPEYSWVALLVELFIMISITVSYLTVGAAMHHTLSGVVEAVMSKDKFTSYVHKIQSSKKMRFMNSECFFRAFVSLIAFAIIFTVAMLNPQGFEAMLERAASLFINLEVAIFVFLMIQKATNKENRHLRIALKLPSVVYHLNYILAVYFGFAVVYDLFISVYSLATQGAPLPWESSSRSGIVPAEEYLYLNTTLAQLHNASLVGVS